MRITGNEIIIGILLIALMIPVVNAVNSHMDSGKLVSHLQFNDSQTIQKINDGFHLSADNTRAARSPNVIPVGSTIYHRNGVTRVFDSEGKQVSIIEDSGSEKIATPAGMMPATQVYEVPDGALIRRDGEIAQVIVNNRTISTVINAETASLKTGSLQVPTIINWTWIEYANNDSIPNLGRFYAEWTVPTSPTNTTSQLVDFLFTGISPYFPSEHNTTLIQPVIEWNNGNSGIWQGRAWYITQDPVGNNSFHSDPINISSGDSITGLMEWNGDTQNWSIIITDNTRSRSVFVEDNRFWMDDLKVYGGVLEAYYVNDRTNLPGTTSFTNMEFRDTDNQPVNFNWDKKYDNAAIYALPGLYVDNISQSQ